MSDEQKKPTIAENERSPASEAAEKVPFGAQPHPPEDESEEPAGTAETPEPKTDADGRPIVPPSRQTH